MLPSDEFEKEKEGICPSNCNIKPFDASFSPRNQSCPFDDIGLDYTLSPPPPPSPIDPTIDIQQQRSANAERCHQRAERGKYRRGGDCVDDADLSLPDPPSSRDLGELYIGESTAPTDYSSRCPSDPTATSARSSATSFLARGPVNPCPRSETDLKPTLRTIAQHPTLPPLTSSPPHAPTGSATSPDTSLVTLTRPPPRANISSRNTGYTLPKHWPSCSTTLSSTLSATRPAARPPIGPRPGPTAAPHLFFQILP